MTATTSQQTLGTVHCQDVCSNNQVLPEWFLLDVRTPAEYATAHIPGSVNIPLDTVKAQVEDIRRLTAAHPKIAVVCRSGGRAKQAFDILAGEGFANIAVLEGGMIQWESNAKPVNRGTETMSLERQVRIAAGSMVAVGTLLGMLVSPYFLVIPLFVGSGLVFAGVTDTCGMGMLLAKMPWNRCAGGTCSTGQCKA